MSRRARLVLEYWSFSWGESTNILLGDEQSAPDLFEGMRPDGEGRMIMPAVPDFLRALADMIEEPATTGPPEDWLDEEYPVWSGPVRNEP